jgi:hypothetical protein
MGAAGVNLPPREVTFARDFQRRPAMILAGAVAPARANCLWHAKGWISMGMAPNHPILTEQTVAAPTESRTGAGVGHAAGQDGAPRYTRRLSDKILIAFHQACDQQDFEVAHRLLRVLEMMITRRPTTPDGSTRRNAEGLIAAHERLWQLKHPDTDEC